MPRNYFWEYSSREEYIVRKRIDTFFSNLWIPCEYIQDNTWYHDCKIRFIYNDIEYEFIVQVKEDELYRYGQTGNLGFDFISAFKYNNDDIKKDCIKNHNRIRKENINDFIENKIKVRKFWKLITCDADIHIFYIEDDNNHETVFLQAYSNYQLQSEEFINYIISHYDLRINKKSDYNLDDDRESAAFFIKPTDTMVKKAEINEVWDLISIYENREDLKNHKSTLFL